MTSRTDRWASALHRWLLPSMALALMSGILFGKGIDQWFWPVAALALAMIGLTVSWKSPLGKRIFVLLFCLGLGACLGWRTWHPELPEARTYHVTGIVSEEIRDGDNSQHKTCLQPVMLDGVPWTGGAYWSFYSDEIPQGLRPGVTVEGDFQLYHPSGAENPGGFDFREYLLQRGIRIGLYGCVNLSVRQGPLTIAGTAAALRHALCEKLRAVMGEQAGSYAATMLLGIRNLIDTEERDAFSRAGIAHILSVSGFHVAVLFGAISGFLSMLHVPRRIRFPAIAILLLAYAVLTGMGAPVLRAAILILLQEYGHLRHRPRESLHLLSAAAIITLMIAPAQLTAAGFQLSYAALLGLIVIRPTLVGERRIGSLRDRYRFVDKLHDALMTSLAVQIGILLPQLYWYQELPVLSLVLNVLVLFLASFLLGGYWVLLIVMWLPVIGPAVGRLLAVCTDLLSGFVLFIADHDWITLWTCQADFLTALGWITLGIGLCMFWRMKKRHRFLLSCIGIAAIVLSVMPWPHRGTDYIQFSVGNADAAVLWDDDTVWVIDAGEDSTASTYLHQHRLSVDTLVITHLHKDHIMGVSEMIHDRIPIKRVLIPEGAERQAVAPECAEVLNLLSKRGTEIIHVGRGDAFVLPSGSMTVLWPEHGRVRSGQDANHYSLCSLYELHGVRFLTAGDLTETYEAYSAVPADVLKAAHHGSEHSTSSDYLRAVSPKAILLSGGDRRRWERMNERADPIPVWGTQNVGALILHFDRGEVTIRGFNLPALE